MSCASDDCVLLQHTRQVCLALGRAPRWNGRPSLPLPHGDVVRQYGQSQRGPSVRLDVRLGGHDGVAELAPVLFGTLHIGLNSLQKHENYILLI
jgi:hypothetical protein